MQRIKNPGSKPKKWNTARPQVAYLLALLGATDMQIAEVMMVDIETINHWKRTKPEFLAELRRGKIGADTKVVEAFYKSAVGYYYDEDHVSIWKGEVTVTKVRKYMPPHPWSCARWLQLRQREMWAEKTKMEITNTNINVQKLDLSDVSVEQLKLLRDIGIKQITQNAGDSQL